jgi:SAM-dependent methyltransferase/uncharacterized protein YbaR (Trm112 family)
VKRRLVDRLRCPTCSGALDLLAFASAADEVVRDGVLLCETCLVRYPVTSHVPVLLDFETPLHGWFDEEHPADVRRVERYGRPRGTARPGELLTQRSFTAEWTPMADDELTFGYTHAQREDFIRLELDWPPRVLDGDEGPVLDVGCGAGLEALALHAVTGREVFATDLNLSLLGTGARIDEHPHVHTVVASLFALPFERRSFELVYSHGVLHHTYSTRRAFDAVESFRSEGGVVYIWVYAEEDMTTGIRIRVGYLGELLARPTIARLPAAPQTAVVGALAAHHYLRVGRRAANRDKWRYANSVHSVRDRWTSYYAHRHSFHEVMTWFLEKGLEFRFVDSLAYERTFGYPLIGIGIRATAAGDTPARSAIYESVVP